MFHVPEKYRVPHIVRGVNVSTPEFGNNGMFKIKHRAHSYPLRVVASDGASWEKIWPLPAWEHVSVSTPVRCPTWEEMCLVKDLFWEPDDAVFQIHPPAREYVSHHDYCLHLWRPIGIELPRPPFTTVGPASALVHAR